VAEGLARALSSSLLDEVALPNGASVTTSVPALVAQPFNPGNPTNLIDDHRLWAVPAPADATWRFIMGRAPSDIGNYGGGPNNGRLMAEGYVLRPPVQIDHAVLSLQVVASGPTASIVRADALVVWLPERSLGEVVSATDSVVTVTRTLPFPGHSTPPAPQVVTDTAWVRVFTEAFNGLPIALPAAMTCNTKDAETEGVVAFSAESAPTPDIVATLHPCSAGFLVTVEVRGTPAQPLKDIGGFYGNLYGHSSLTTGYWLESPGPAGGSGP
jgi:hypothetical protein